MRLLAMCPLGAVLLLLSSGAAATGSAQKTPTRVRVATVSDSSGTRSITPQSASGAASARVVSEATGQPLVVLRTEAGRLDFGRAASDRDGNGNGNGKNGRRIDSSPVASAPLPSPGIEVRRFSRGYMSYEKDDSDEDSGEEQGGVVVVPAHEAQGLSMRDGGADSGDTWDTESRSSTSRSGTRRERTESARRGNAAKQAGDHSGDHLRIPELPKDRCVHERGRLAQRLLELRGIQIGPAEALIVIEEAEQPLSGVVRRSLFGLESAGVGGTLLQSAVSYDLETRERLSRLVRCMGH